MSEQGETQIVTLQRPTNDDREAWKAYWESKGQLWRNEPEIDNERQMYLNERRMISPDIEKGIYPFKDIKLDRADVEWLLATPEKGEGPVNWNDKSQRERKGLDLRGADLRDADLSRLPLANLRGSMTYQEQAGTTREQRRMAVIHLERVNFSQTHLEGAKLRHAHLEKANLEFAHLEQTDCVSAHLEGAYLGHAYLSGTHLQRVSFDSESYLNDIYLGNEKDGFVSLVDVNWNGVNLATVRWQELKMLGQEEWIRQKRTTEGKIKDKPTRIHEYEMAVRGNRQLAVVLQTQGLNEDAARFAYRAQKLQRVVLQQQRKFNQYLFSLFLDLIAGYGYRPIRSLLWYLCIIFGFAIAYHSFGRLPFLPDSFVFSLTSFHGRGFFPGLGNETSLHNPLVVLAATEAVVGLFIEISFIATFTQRYFGK